MTMIDNSDFDASLSSNQHSFKVDQPVLLNSD